MSKTSQKQTDEKDYTDHKNSNSFLGNFVIYIIIIFEKIFKFGKADADRITQSSGLPTRLHQQVRKLRDEYGEENVTPDVIQTLENASTKEAKNLEKSVLQDYYEQTNEIPKGNQKSFKPKKK